MLHTAFIAGHICVPVGGGEDAVVVSSLRFRKTSGRRLTEGCYRLSSVSLSFWFPWSLPSWSGPTTGRG
jgi:hypothetical protein